MPKTVSIAMAAVLYLPATHYAHAQKEVVGMLAMLSLAPDVCSWSDAASPLKIDEQIDVQLKTLGMSAEDWRQIRNAAKASLQADPANCKDAGFRSVYDEAAK